MNKKKKVMIGMVLGAVGCVLGVVVRVCFSGEVEAEPVSVPVVETEYPEIGDIELFTSLIGSVEPEYIARIYPEASGTVTDIFVKAGDVVAAGQPVCTIDTKLVDSAENSMKNAEISLREAQTDLGRMEILFGSGGISQQEYENYVNAAKKAELAYRQASADYEKQYSFSHITAPISGRVESCGVEVFDRVSEGNQICVIAGGGDVIISFQVTDVLRKKIQVGDMLEAKKSDNFYTGRIVEMSEMADAATGLYQVKAVLEESPAGELSTGAVVKLSLCSNRVEQALTVSVDAVYYENSLPYVFTFEDGVIHKAFIESGIYDAERMEVKAGLSPRDMVVVTWNPELFEGAQAMLADEFTAEGAAVS